MIRIRKSEERGHVNHGWLEAKHSFSFGGYFDPKHRGFRDLLVINEDRVAAGMGFGKHGHENMEIVTYVLNGALEHKDSMGTSSVLKYGDVQRMSAGKGVHHSEFNHSKEEPLHLFQIWIATRKDGIEPGYEEKNFNPESKKNQLKLLVSQDGRDGSITIHQDASFYATILEEKHELSHRIAPGRHAWIQLARGVLEVNGVALQAGDGAAISDETELRLLAKKESEAVLIDLT